MKHQKKIIAVMIMAMLGFSTVAAAAEKGNWKKGRIYFRMVFSDCHELGILNSDPPFTPSA